VTYTGFEALARRMEQLEAQRSSDAARLEKLVVQGEGRAGGAQTVREKLEGQAVRRMSGKNWWCRRKEGGRRTDC
jgi:hypothetical protein